MKSIYKIAGYHAYSQADSFENGCYGQSKNEFVSRNDWSIESDTLAGLIALLCDEFKAEPDCVLLNSCDEMGRLDIQVNQREPFTKAKPSAATIAHWKNGEIDLWLTDYVFHVQLISSEIDLQLTFDTEKEMNK